MDIEDKRIRDAVENTEILRLPKQTLSTFGVTNLYYYLVTEPAYSELIKGTDETVIREGRVVAERPKIVTPYYLSQLEGFSADARRYLELTANEEVNSLAALHFSDVFGRKEVYQLSSKASESEKDTEE